MAGAGEGGAGSFFGGVEGAPFGAAVEVVFGDDESAVAAEGFFLFLVDGAVTFGAGGGCCWNGHAVPDHPSCDIKLISRVDKLTSFVCEINRWLEVGSDGVVDSVEVGFGEGWGIAEEVVDGAGVVRLCAGDDVPVGVGDFLAGCGAVVDGDGGCGGVSRGFDGGRDVVDGFHEVGGGVGWNVVKTFVVVGGDNEGVAGGEWVCVEERAGRVGCIDGAAGSVVVRDLTKHTRHTGMVYGGEGNWFVVLGRFLGDSCKDIRMPIEFRRSTQTASFYSPLEEFDRVEVDVEVREDPVTGRRTRIVSENFLLPEEEPDIDEFVSDAEGCFFCPELVDEATPTYRGMIGMERGSKGEATSFPNLHPYGGYSNVVVLTDAHFVPIDGFTTDVLTDGIGLAVEYISSVMDGDAEMSVASVNMNYLRPAGSSIVHPHLQTLVDRVGTNDQSRLYRGVKAYRDESNESYWEAVLDAEETADRVIGETGSVTWVAPFAPKHHWHIRGIPAYSGVPAGDANVIRDVAEGIVNVFEFYGAIGLNSCNFVMHIAEGRRPIIEIIGRSVFDSYYWSDATFFTVLHDESVIDVPPEDYARDAQSHF